MIAGQGTIALEVLNELENIDAIVVPVGFSSQGDLPFRRRKPADEMFSISKMRGRIHLAQLSRWTAGAGGCDLPSLLFASIAGSQVEGLGRSAVAQGGDEAGS